MITGTKPSGSARSNRSNGRGRNDKTPPALQRDLLSPFTPPTLDLDPLVHPTKDRHPNIPEILHPGTLLLSQRHGIKCTLLDSLEEVDIKKLKDICLRKFNPTQAVYLPMGTPVLKDEILHQGRQFVVKLRKGTLFLSPGGHPNGYLLATIQLPLDKELTSNMDILFIGETAAKNHLQKLVDIPTSFALIKEDLLYDESGRSYKIEKGTLLISRGGALTGFMLEDVHLPLKKSMADLDALFPLKSTYQSLPIETLIQRDARGGSKGLDIDRGTFLFSPHGKIYFVWKDEVKATSEQIRSWAMTQVVHSDILSVSTTKNNNIGGPGVVITQDEITYLRDVFRQAGSTNILRESLLLDRNVFYKFIQDMPYAQTGKFRGYLRTGQIIMLNTFRKGTFSVELGGDKITITDLDLVQIRKYLPPTGRLLIKLGTLLRIRDERDGDWVYRATTNLFYQYDTFTRPYMEEFIPESLAFDHRAEKLSTIIGPQEKPATEDKGADGEPLGDLLAMINIELSNDRIVFVLDDTLFHWKGRLFRVNEELVYRYQDIEKLERQDFDALEAEWKIHPLVEEVSEFEEEIPEFEEDDEDLEDLPFDTSARG